MTVPPAVRWTLLVIAITPATGLLLAALAPTGWWPAHMLLHWAPQLAVLTLPLWCWIGRRPLPGIALVVLAAAALWPWLIAVHVRRAAAPAPSAAVVTTANLYYLSPDHRAALERIAGDLVCLVETLPADRERLRGDPRWPQQRWLVPRNLGGMALLSRWPMRSTEIELAGACTRASMA